MPIPLIIGAAAAWVLSQNIGKMIKRKPAEQGMPDPPTPPVPPSAPGPKNKSIA
jgi:hypothetical protein